jgi:hypothetical protein
MKNFDSCKYAGGNNWKYYDYCLNALFPLAHPLQTMTNLMDIAEKADIYGLFFDKFKWHSSTKPVATISDYAICHNCPLYKREEHNQHQQ